MEARHPLPTVERLCRIYQLCTELLARGVDAVSSRDLGAALGVSAWVVRKDISLIGETGSVGARYRTGRLREHLAGKLGLGKSRRACVVGLGRLGAALLEHRAFARSGVRIAAGFDTSINRLETIRTDVPLYPAYDLADVVRREAIEIGIIATPGSAAQQCAAALADAGVCGILNFAPSVVSVARAGVTVRNVDLSNELRVLSALIFTSQPHDPSGAG